MCFPIGDPIDSTDTGRASEELPTHCTMECAKKGYMFHLLCLRECRTTPCFLVKGATRCPRSQRHIWWPAERLRRYSASREHHVDGRFADPRNEIYVPLLMSMPRFWDGNLGSKRRLVRIGWTDIADLYERGVCS